MTKREPHADEATRDLAELMGAVERGDARRASLGCAKADPRSRLDGVSPLERAQQKEDPQMVKLLTELAELRDEGLVGAIHDPSPASRPEDQKPSR